MLMTPTSGTALAECSWLAAAVYSLMDHGRYGECAALFTDDAVWVRGGQPVAGRETILAALGKRPERMVSRHLVTNIVVEVLDDASATATACFVPMRGDRRDDGSVEMPALTGMGDLFFTFRREAGGWRIARLEPKMVFTK